MSAGSLFPVFALPPAVQNRPAGSPAPAAPGAVPPTPGRPSYAFDVGAGEYVLDGAGRVAVADPATAWVQWCVKALLVPRLSAMAETPRYGLDVRAIRSARPQTRPVVEAAVRKGITDCLLLHPGTASVGAFRFRWRADAVAVRFVVRPVAGTPVPFNGVLDDRLAPSAFAPDPGWSEAVRPEAQRAAAAGDTR